MNFGTFKNQTTQLYTKVTIIAGKSKHLSITGLCIRYDMLENFQDLLSLI